MTGALDKAPSDKTREMGVGISSMLYGAAFMLIPEPHRDYERDLPRVRVQIAPAPAGAGLGHATPPPPAWGKSP